MCLSRERNHSLCLQRIVLVHLLSDKTRREIKSYKYDGDMKTKVRKRAAIKHGDYSFTSVDH